MLSVTRICLPYTPVQALSRPFFSKTPSAMFYCRDAPPRRLLDTHSWHSARGRCMAAFDTRCRCFSTHLLERGSAVQRGRRRRRVGSRRDCVWTFLNFAPSAEGGVHGSGLKNQGKTANVTAIPKKNRLRRQGFSSGGSKMRHVARRRCGCGSENAPQISLVPAKQRVSAVGRSDWEPCPVEKKLDLEQLQFFF